MIQQYEVVIEKDVPVYSRDGTVLMADIYRPGLNGEIIDGQFPTVLWRTSYDKTRPNFSSPARYFCRRGYVAVVQDIRGRGKSGGYGEIWLDR